MPAPYQDTFSGANGSALGTIELGGVSWSVLTGTWTRTGGFAATTTADSSNPLAVVDVGDANVDVSLSVATPGGDCIYFRVVDASNWLRARVQATEPPTVYTIEIEKCVSGTVSKVSTISPGIATNLLRVVVSNSTITVYGNSVQRGVVIDGTNSTATQHGIGRGTGTGQRSSNRSAIDNFALTPLSRVPNSPTLTFPVGGVTVDGTIAQRFAWTFSDPDPGDSQSKANLYYKLTSDTSWTPVTISGPNGFYDFPAGTFADGDYEWQVETYDALGHLGARSASSFFTAGTPSPGPTFTSPTNGSTIGDATAVFDWTTTAQDSYQIRKVADDGSGSPDTATVYFDTGEVVDSAARTITLDFPTNSRTEHVQIRVKVAGLWSDWTDSTHPVSYTPPAKPNLAVVADDSTASITVSVTQPSPSGDQPDASSVDIYRRILSNGTAVDGSSIRLATNLAASVDWTDWTPASSQIYQYQAVAVAANSTTTASNWIPAAVPNGVAVYDTSTYDDDSSLYD